MQLTIPVSSLTGYKHFKELHVSKKCVIKKDTMSSSETSSLEIRGTFKVFRDIEVQSWPLAWFNVTK